MTGNASIHRHVRAERFHAAIASRTVRLSGGSYSHLHHLLILDGSTRIIVDEDQSRLSDGPGCAFIPALKAACIVIAAGARATVMGVSAELLVDAIGSKAESHSLRLFSEQSFFKDDDAGTFSEVQPLVDGFLIEARDPHRESWMVVSAYTRLILMAFWRGSGGALFDDSGQGEVASILQRFRQLVEVHFRAQSPVSDYADRLGVTPDRLHAICTRALGRAPLKLIHDRVVHEARLRLERSAGTISQISHELGFRDPTYFSQFFKRLEGRSPADYRRQVRNAAGTLPPVVASFADWP